MKKKLFHGQLLAAAVLFLISLLIIFLAAKQQKTEETKTREMPKITLTLWYAGSLYQNYLEEGARQYEEKTGVKVELVEKSQLSYMEEIQKADEAGAAPDLILTDSTAIQNLLWIGAAAKTSFSEDYKKSNFVENAFSDLEYEGISYGYPLGFDAVVLMYRSSLENEMPENISEVLADDRKSVFLWDTENFLYNYAFFAEYTKFDADDTKVDVCSKELQAAALIYQKLYRKMGAHSYAQVLDAMRTGTADFSIVRADVLSEKGSWQTETALKALPSLDETLTMVSPAVTDILMCNPFSGRTEQAEKFARFLSLDMAGQMYEQTKILPLARCGVTEDSKVFYEAYQNGKKLPKSRVLQGFWTEMNQVMKEIRDGGSIEEILTSFQNSFAEKYE